jgi:hypothetical protein
MINITNEIRNVPSSGSGMSGYVMPLLLRGDTPQPEPVFGDILEVQPRYKAQGNALPLNRSIPRGNPEDIHLENDVGGIQSPSSGISEYVIPFETTPVQTEGAYTGHDTLAAPNKTADGTGETADFGYALQFPGRRARDTEQERLRKIEVNYEKDKAVLAKEKQLALARSESHDVGHAEVEGRIGNENPKQFIRKLSACFFEYFTGY